MVIVAFPPGEKYAVNYTTLDQYDYGQILRIQGLKLPKTVEVHFSTQETGGTSITRVGVTKDGVTDVLIPDSVLENGDTTQNYSIFAFVYVTDATSGKTEYRAKLEVKARPKPEVPGGGDNPDIFHEAVLEVRKSAEKAEEAQRQAEGWAHGREDLPERAEDNAKYYSRKASEDAKKTAEDRKEVERLVESVSGIDEQVAKVEKLSKDAQEAATQAGTSAEQAELHKQAAETASSAAQTAAQETEADKVSVEKLSAQVQKNKESVDKTAQDFALNTQQALADVNNAGQAQTERVQTAGTTAVENIKTAQSTATGAVETAKAEAVKAVQTEGTTQTGNVTTEGERQVQAVQTAAQEIIADREQIAKNATDIAELRQKKANAIVESVSGTLLNVKDSSGAFFEDFFMSGKTVQDGTPTPDAPVEIVNAGQDGTIEIKITGKNLIPFPYPDIKEVRKIVHLKGVDYTVLQDGGVHLKGTPQDMFGLNICTIPFKEYGTVKASNLIYYDPNNDKTFFLLNDYLGKAIDVVVYPQVEVGTVATPYEPYRQPQTITLQLAHPLTKWDKLKKREGVWGIARQGETKVLKATPEEKWAAWEDKQNAFFIMNDKVIKEGLCSHFEAKGSFEIGKETGIYLSETIHLIVTNMNIDSLESWKTWLQANPITVTYKTAEETWKPLPEEMQSVLNALHTNYPTTVVSNSEDTEMELTYIADTKNYYLSREQVLQKQILDIQNAMISQKISGGGIKVTNSAKLPIVKLSVFGKSEQVTTTGKNLWGFGDISFKGYKELSVNYPAGNYVLSFGIETEASSNTAQTGICIDGIWKYYQVKKDNRAAIKISSATGITAVRFYAGDSPAVKDNAEYYNIQIEKKADATDYEPYTGGKPSPSPEYPQKITSCGESGTIDLEITGDNVEPQTLTIPTPNGLLGLKVDVNGNYTDENGQQWICDEIDLARGKYAQRIGKHVCTGNENIFKSVEDESVIEYMFHAEEISSNALYESNGLSTHYEYLNARKGGTCTIGAGKYAYIRYNVADNVTPAQIQEFYRQQKEAGTPVTFYYILAEPVEYDLPPETIAAFNQLHTNYPTTIITNNAGAGMELTYTVDTQSYIDGKIATLSKAIL